MNQLRVRIFVLVFWLILFFNAERIFEPLSIAQITYALVVALVLFMLVFQHMLRVPGWMVLTTSIAVLLVVKYWVRLPSGVDDIVISITEVIAVVTSALLTHWVNKSIQDFECAVDHITIGRLDRLFTRGTGGESVLYREVRRARNHKRPLALLAISVDEKSVNISLDRIVQETQAAMAKHYALAGVSKVLCNSLEDSDVVVQRNDHFLIVLPETMPDNLPRLIDRLRRKVHDEVGVDVKVGIAALPQDGLTFEGLIDKATLEMIADQDKIHAIELDRVPSEKLKQ